MDRKDKIRLYTNYILIGIVSFIALVILPFVGGNEIEGGISLPNTTPGWIIWIFNRITVSTINIMLFHCFMQQGRVNSENTESYIEAMEILKKVKDKAAREPRSPFKFLGREYSHKVFMLVISTLAASVALTQMILSFNLAAFVSIFLVVLGGLIFGILQMKKAEEYWQVEFLMYAKDVQKKVEAAQKAMEELTAPEEPKEEEPIEEPKEGPKEEPKEEELPDWVIPENNETEEIQNVN